MADQDSAMFKYHLILHFWLWITRSIFTYLGVKGTHLHNHTQMVTSRIHCLFEHKQNTIATHVHVDRQDSVCTNGNF